MADAEHFTINLPEYPGTAVYVQPEGCIEISQGGEDLVHIHGQDWPTVVAAVEELQRRRAAAGHVGSPDTSR